MNFTVRMILAESAEYKKKKKGNVPQFWNL